MLFEERRKIHIGRLTQCCYSSLVSNDLSASELRNIFYTSILRHRTKNRICQVSVRVFGGSEGGASERERERLSERERERERERDRDRDRETERQTETETDRQTDPERERQTDRQRQRHRQTDRQTDPERETETDRDRQTDRQTDRQKDRQKAHGITSPQDDHTLSQAIYNITFQNSSHIIICQPPNPQDQSLYKYKTKHIIHTHQLQIVQE